MRGSTAVLMALALAGCSPGQLSTEMSAPPPDTRETEAVLATVLRESFDTTASPVTFRKDPAPAEVKRYLAAGFALTDIYCDRFFRSTNAAFRRRRFGRTVTNDVGTAIGTILGLVGGVSKGVLTGTSAVTGLADSTWRGFDDAFVVAPELQNVRALVLAAQDEHRRATYETDMPTDYMTARSAIVRYAGLCTFLGMQSLLTQSIDQQRLQLLAKAAPAATPTQIPAAAPAPAASPTPKPAAPTPPASVPPSAPTTEPAARAGAVPVG